MEEVWCDSFFKNRLLSWAPSDLASHKLGSQKCLKEWGMFSPLYDAPGIPSPWRNQNIMSVCSDLQLLTLGTSLSQPLGDLILSLISTPGNSLTKKYFFLVFVFQRRLLFSASPTSLLKFPFWLQRPFHLHSHPSLSVCTVLFFVSLFLSALFL